MHLVDDTVAMVRVLVRHLVRFLVVDRLGADFGNDARLYRGTKVEHSTDIT